jgi:hypothetical protein
MPLKAPGLQRGDKVARRGERQLGVIQIAARADDDVAGLQSGLVSAASWRDRQDEDALLRQETGGGLLAQRLDRLDRQPDNRPRCFLHACRRLQHRFGQNGLSRQRSQARRAHAELIHRKAGKTERQRRRRIPDVEIARRGIDELGVARDGVPVRPVFASPREVRRVREQIPVDALSPCLDADRLVRGHDDVALEYVATVLEPDMRVKGRIHGDVVADDAIETFPQLETTRQQEVLFDDVVRRAVVQVDVPPVLALEAVAPHDDRFDRVQRDQRTVGRHAPVHFLPVGMPVTVPPPTVECAVIGGFAHCVEHIVIGDPVPAPGAVADVDARPRHLIDRVVVDRNARGHRDFHAGRLLVDQADVMDQVIFRHAVARILVRLRAGRPVDRRQGQAFTVFEQRRTHGVGTADEGDCRAADRADMVARDGDLAGPPVDDDRVPAQIAEIGIADDDGRSVLDRDGADAIELPVRTQQRFGGLEECRLGVREFQILDPDVLYGRSLAFDTDQGFEPSRTEPDGGRACPVERLVVEPSARTIVEPFARRIELLENILDIADIRNGRGRAVIAGLRAELQAAVRILPQDRHVHAAPAAAMQGVKHAAGRIAPGRDALRRRGVCRRPAERRHGRVVVGIARTDQHVRTQPQTLEWRVRQLRAPDAVFPTLPAQPGQRFGAAQDGMRAGCSRQHERLLCGAGQAFVQDDGRGKRIGSRSQFDTADALVRACLVQRRQQGLHIPDLDRFREGGPGEALHRQQSNGDHCLS